MKLLKLGDEGLSKMFWPAYFRISIAAHHIAFLLASDYVPESTSTQKLSRHIPRLAMVLENKYKRLCSHV